MPIGRPIANTQLYVLDEGLEPVPIGVSGELYIGGAGLARGYLKRAGLTAQRFIANPFGEGERLYCTGDLARYRADGNLEFIGRRDDQVKVRGYRIELGEVESALLSHAAVSQAVVVARQEEEGEKRLIAYYVASEALEVSELRAHLKHQLPEYMVPGMWVQLQVLPLTPSGKIDRKALPAPEGRPQIGGYVAPRTPLEQTLARIWAEVLHLEQVGVEDNFFELGGHSLLVMRSGGTSPGGPLQIEVLRCGQCLRRQPWQGWAQKVCRGAVRQGAEDRVLPDLVRGEVRPQRVPLIACTGALMVLRAVGVGGHSLQHAAGA